MSTRIALGRRIRELAEAGTPRVVTGFKAAIPRDTVHGVVVHSEGEALDPVDEIIAVTGFQPDLTMTSELRLSLDPAVESPTALTPLIDPNVHSCGTAPPHGAEELRHPERDFYVVGMKSYGRAPTSLLLIGDEQVRSVAAAPAGDWAAARDVQLVLPDTGVCSSDEGSGSSRATPNAPTPLAVLPRRPAPVRELALAGVGARTHEADRPQAYLEAEPVSSCCAPGEQEICCDPSEKAICCGSSAEGTCGCR